MNDEHKLNSDPKSPKQRKRQKFTENVEFHLPQLSLKKISNIISGYSSHEEVIKYRDLAEEINELPDNVSISHRFLIDTGLMKGEHTRIITPLGRELGRALKFNYELDIQKHWREVIKNTEFFRKVLIRIRELGKVTRDELQSHIYYIANINNPTPVHKTGANVIIDILVLTNYVAYTEKRFSALRIPEHFGEGKDNSLQILKGFEHLEKYYRSFVADHPDKEKTVFLMMRYRRNAQFEQLYKVLKQSFASHGFELLKANDKDYTDNVWDNICLYMLACNYGATIFEEIDEKDFNPNVSIELGFMLALGKRCLILKDDRMKLPTDIIGKLFKSFSTYEIEETVEKAVESWFNDLGI